MAQALNCSTGNSLVLVDEFGKGTNTVRRRICFSVLLIEYICVHITRKHSVTNAKRLKPMLANIISFMAAVQTSLQPHVQPISSSCSELQMYIYRVINVRHLLARELKIDVKPEGNKCSNGCFSTAAVCSVCYNVSHIVYRLYCSFGNWRIRPF